jgi:hypothetical protein
MAQLFLLEKHAINEKNKPFKFPKNCTVKNMVHNQEHHVGALH